MKVHIYLGYSKAKTFSKIHVPYLKNNIILIVVLLSLEIIKELPITMILRPFNFETFATQSYVYASQDLLEAAALPALFLIIWATIFILFSSKYILSQKTNIIKKCQNIFLKYQNGNFIASEKNKVNNVNLIIENQGQIISLLGPSGIGKTTILRTLDWITKIKFGKIFIF